MHNAWITTSGEKMSKSLGNSLLVPHVLERVRGIELRYYMVAAHYRSTVEFSFEALAEAAAGFQRIEGFLERAAAGSPQMLDRDVREADPDVTGQHLLGLGDLPEAFARAMDDDLGTPAAVGVLHDTVRAGNKALADGDRETAATYAGQVRAMLGVLGLDPADPHWSGNSAPNDLTAVVDALVKGLLEQRAQARADKDFAAADAIRDQIKAAGITIEDTPSGPKWSVADARSLD